MSYNIEEKRINDIYGVLYRPKIDKKIPIIIFSHGLGSTHKSGDIYAKHLSKLGYAFYEFDFRNGGNKSKSGNDTTKMSVMTETNDLLEVLEEIKTWNFIDQDNIILMGASQGGLVTALIAHKVKVKQIILLYPAFIICDIVHKYMPSIDKIPETFNFQNWVTLGKPYAKDIWDLDAYTESSKYEGKVLIIHGMLDHLVPITYSKKANKIFNNCTLKKIRNADHGFYDEDLNEALKYIEEVLK